jgi:hypothetical protein
VGSLLAWGGPAAGGGARQLYMVLLQLHGGGGGGLAGAVGPAMGALAAAAGLAGGAEGLAEAHGEALLGAIRPTAGEGRGLCPPPPGGVDTACDPARGCWPRTPPALPSRMPRSDHDRVCNDKSVQRLAHMPGIACAPSPLPAFPPPWAPPCRLLGRCSPGRPGAQCAAADSRRGRPGAPHAAAGGVAGPAPGGPGSRRRPAPGPAAAAGWAAGGWRAGGCCWCVGRVVRQGWSWRRGVG